MLLHLKLIQASVIEAAEFWRHSAERPNECEQRRDHVCDEPEARPPSGVEITFSFGLQVVQSGSRCETQLDQVKLAKRCEYQVAGLLSQIKRALHHRRRGLNRTSPGQDVVGDDTVDLAAKTREIVSLGERCAQVTKSEAVAVMAETRTDRHTQLGKRHGRSVAVTMLQAEVRHAEDDKVVEPLVGIRGAGREHGEQNLHDREQIRVYRCRQIDERLDRPISDALTEAIEFRANLLLIRTSRPFYSKPS